MKSDRARLVRRVLLGVLVAVSVAVAWSLRRPEPRSSGKAEGAGAAAQGSSVRQLTFSRFLGGNQKIELRARSQVGEEGAGMRFAGVELRVPFTGQGRSSMATITADRCDYRPQPRQQASFAGTVKVRTDDGFELETESLDYVSDPVEVTSEAPVRFRQGTGSGSARGMDYGAESGLRLHSEVRVRLEDQAGPATEIESGSANASRGDSILHFEDGVVVHQGSRELHSKRLQLNMTEDWSTVERAAAIEDVDLRVGSGASVLPGAAVGRGTGEKHVRCRRLNLAFRAKGVLEEASAVNPGILELQSGPGGPPELRRLSASVIRFLFDEQGRLTSVEASAAGANGPPEQQLTVLTSEPTAKGALARRVESQTLTASLDPVGGDVQRAEFDGRVIFSEGGRKGWADHASYDAGPGLLILTGAEPRLVDEEQGSELRARQIRVGSRSSGVWAQGSVRHTITRPPAKKEGKAATASSQEPTVIVCRQFEYDPASKTAHYHDNVLMRSGQDESRAPQMTLAEAAEGERRLSASGGIVSLLHPRPGKGKAKEPAPVETRSREMVYDEKAHRIVYTGEVEIRQGDILTKAPEGVALLAADGQTVERVLVGSPVEMHQGARIATGERGTYTPGDETLVLVGEKVHVRELDRSIEGRYLTFKVGGDRIRVDGREEVRTETVLKRKEQLKP